MKFCLHSRLESEYLQKADEIKVDTRDYKSIPDLFEKYPDKDIILELFHKEDKDWNELRRFGILSKGHLILCLDNPDDFLIMKDAGKELVSVTNENEFEKALELYRNKIAG